METLVPQPQLQSRSVPARRVDAIRIIGVPMDLGASRRGVDMGPSAVRLANLDERLRGLGYAVDDCGNVRVPDRTTLAGATGRDYLPTIAQVC